MCDLLAKESLVSSSLKPQFNLQYTGFFSPCIPRCTHMLLCIPKIKPATLPVFFVQLTFSFLAYFGNLSMISGDLFDVNMLLNRGQMIK